MRYYILIGCILTSTACSKWKRDTDPKDPTNEIAEHVEAKSSFYVQHADEARDEQGFVHGKCDALLFRALWSVATNRPDRSVIMQAMGDRGRWYRHALHDCYAKGESPSDISNDMLLGLAIYAWQFRDLDIVQGVIEYGKAHNWVMGEGDPFRAIMRPTLIATYYDIARELGADPGPTPQTAPADLTNSTYDSYCGWTGHLEDVCDKASLVATVPTGFEAHLQVLHGLLRALALGGASQTDLDTFKAQADRQSRNALFQAVYHLYLDGDQEAAVAALADDGLFPPGRLPTVADRCEEYLYQRDDDAEDPEGDWRPCSGVGKPHSGTDLLFALAVSKNLVRKR